MTTFVVVAAVRIQDWLSRTSELRLIRGASAALAEDTRADTIGACLESLGLPDVSVDASVPDVDGVVVLRAPNDEAAARARTRLIAHLRSRLPAVEWQVWLADADSYAAALAQRQNGAVSVLQLPPVLSDVGLARTCSSCRAEEDRLSIAPPERGLGADCLRRLAGTSVARKFLTDQLPGEPARDFEMLAAHGGVVRGGELPEVSGASGRTNHLATIAADGNAIGALFARLQQAGDEDMIRRVSLALHLASEETVRSAAFAITPADALVQPVVAHLVGGDDITVTVTAPFAWQFIRHLGQFRDRIEDELGADIPEGLLTGVSLSVGVTFSHASHPFRDAVGRAQAALRIAKQKFRGSSAAVSWVDLTEDGRIFTDRALQLANLEFLGDLSRRGHDLVSSVSHLSPSARAQLASLIVDATTGDTVPDAKCVTIAKDWAERTGQKAMFGLLQARSDSKGFRRELRDALSFARWAPV